MRKFMLSILVLMSISACTPKEFIDLDQFKNVSFVDDVIHLEAEYGYDLDIEEIKFVLGKEGLDLGDIEVDTKKIGTYDVDVPVNKRTFPIKVDVVDTKGPKFSGKKEFTVYQDEKINLKKLVTAKDPVDGKLEVKFDKYDTSKIGKQTIKAKATDKHGNKETITLTLNVEKKPVETQTFASTQSANNTYSQSTAGTQSATTNSSTNSTSKPASKPNISSSAHRNMALEMFNIVNNARAKNGVHKLVWSEELHRGANIRANEISTSFSHTRPNGTFFNTVSHLAYGENLAFGYHSAQSAHEGLMNSPGHRANILDTDFKTMGIGVYQENGTYYYTQLFGY